MDVISLGPLPVASLLWQPRPDAWMLTFACKATFLLKPVESELAPEQQPIHDVDRHWSDDPSWSLYAPCDIVPIRPRADVVLIGHAFAPGGAPTRALTARLIIGDIDKAVEVWCDRSFTQDGVLHEGARFSRVPLLWERAAGGPDTSNPVGIRASARDMYGRRELPNLQQPGITVTSIDSVIEPVGFGPIAAAWPVRRQKLGRHAASWSPTDWHRRPLPQDIDASYFNAAPRDQQTQALRDNERLVLDNLHPEHPHLVTSLPGHHPQAFVERPGRAPQSTPMRADLLWILTDHGVCTLTWRGQISLEDPRAPGVVLIALANPGQVLTWEEVERRARDEDPATSSRIQDVVGTLESTSQTSDEEEDDSPETRTASGPLVAQPGGAVLPFLAASAPLPRPQAPPRVTDMPFNAASAGRAANIPFAAAPPPAAAPAVVPPPMVRAPALSAEPSASPADSPWASAPAQAQGRPPPVTIGEAAIQAAASPAPAAPKVTGAASASDAAAGASAPWSLPRAEAASAPAASAQPTVRPAARIDQNEVLQILWFNPDAIPRIRRKPAWRRILDEAEKDGAVDPDAADPAFAKDPSEVEDRRDVFLILAGGATTDGAGVNDALASGVRDDGRYVSSLILVAGDLSFPFDELETLKATITTVTPLVGNDENLRASVEVAKDFLKTPELRSAPAVAEGLTTRIREAFAQGRRAVPAGYLDAQTERVLLEQRHYQRREVLGGPHIRALLHTPGTSAPVPTYLPDALSKKLPLYQRMKVRLIAEVHLALDQYETHAAALEVAALARLMPAPGRK